MYLPAQRIHFMPLILLPVAPLVHFPAWGTAELHMPCAWSHEIHLSTHHSVSNIWILKRSFKTDEQHKFQPNSLALPLLPSFYCNLMIIHCLWERICQISIRNLNRLQQPTLSTCLSSPLKTLNIFVPFPKQHVHLCIVPMDLL